MPSPGHPFRGPNHERHTTRSAACSQMTAGTRHLRPVLILVRRSEQVTPGTPGWCTPGEAGTDLAPDAELPRRSGPARRCQPGRDGEHHPQLGYKCTSHAARPSGRVHHRRWTPTGQSDPFMMTITASGAPGGEPGLDRPTGRSSFTRPTSYCYIGPTRPTRFQSLWRSCCRTVSLTSTNTSGTG